MVGCKENNRSFPFIRDAFAILGSSEYEYSSVLHLKDTYHTINLSENAMQYCAMLPFFLVLLVVYI